MLRVTFLLAVFASPLANAGTHAAGSPGNGATNWASNCAGCHVGSPSSILFPAQHPLSYYADSPSSFTSVFTPTNPVVAMTPAVVTGMLAIQNDYSAYFASLMTPVLNTPSYPAFASGATFTPYQITAQTGKDYLVATTTYGITFVSASSAMPLPPALALSVDATGLVTGTLPTVTARTVYILHYDATNTNPVGGGMLTGTTNNFAIIVNPPTPVIGSAATATAGTVGVNASLYAITSSNTIPTSYAVVAAASPNILPPGMTLDAATGVVSGTPTTAGTFTPTLSATSLGAPASGTQVVSFTINKGNQTLSFGAAPTGVKVNLGASTGAVSASSLNASSTASGLAVSYSVPTTTTICSVDPNTGAVTGKSVGTCTVAADQAGDASYFPATRVTQDVTVGMGDQAITFNTPLAVHVGATTANALSAATMGASTQPVVFTSGTPSVCTVSGTNGASVLGVTAGTCTVYANQAGDANYNAAVTNAASHSFQILAAGQTITNLAAKDAANVVIASLAVNATATLSATGGGSTSPVVFSSKTLGVCSVSGNTVTALSSGTCTVAANQAADANYAAATTDAATLSIAVGLAPQAISVSSTVSAMTYLGANQTVTVTPGGSGNAVTFSVAPASASICSIASSTPTSVTVAPIAAGACTINADQVGTASLYANATTLPINITINKANQSIGTLTVPVLGVGGSGVVSAAATPSGLTVTYSVAAASAGVCSIPLNSNTVSALAAGTCTVQADQAGDANFNPATRVTHNIVVGQGGQTITNFAALASTISVGGSTTVSATAGASNVPVTFSIINSSASVCTATGTNGSTITGMASGTCTVVANEAGSANYNAATPVTLNIAVNAAAQTIVFGTAPTVGVGISGRASVVVASRGSSGNAVTFSSQTPAVCTVNANTGEVTGLTTGLCTIAADQLGNAQLAAATQATQSFTIGQGSQTISFAAAPTLAVGATATVTATATSGLPVVLSSATPSICTVTGNTVTAVKEGSCVITANQPGDTSYSPATQATLSFTVTNLPLGVSAAIMKTALNTSATLDLSPYVTGSGLSGITISSQAAHGTVSVSGTNVTYTPKQDFFGTDTFSYRAYGNLGVSGMSAIVTVIVSGRPDPLKDARVTGLVNVETAAVKRFSKAQVFNFQQRLESRHHALFSSLADNSPNICTADDPFGGTLAGGSLPDGQTRGYFNSWQPGSAQNYANNPAILLNAPAPVSAVPGGANTPLSSLLANVVSGVLTGYSLNLGTFSNAVGGAANGSEDRLELWAAGNLRFGTRTQSGVDTRFSTDGISVGADKRLSNQLTLGMGMGYARDKSSIGTDGTNSNSNGNSVAVYGSYLLESGGFLDGLLGYGKVTFDTNRYVASVNDFARARRLGDQIFGSLSFGYEYRNEGLLWSPYGRYDFAYDRLNEGTESGAGANALSYASQTARNSQLAFGMRAQSVHQASFGLVQPSARLEYQRGIERIGQTSIAYADLLGTQYQVAATTQNTHSMVLGLGSEFLLSDTLRFALDYQRLRSAGRENYQSFNFRLTKDIKGKNDFDALLLESYPSSIIRPSGLVVAAGFAYDDNVSRASDTFDKMSDTLNSLTVSQAKTFTMSETTRLTLSGSLDIEKFRTYAGLGRVSGGMQGEFKYRDSGEYGAPTYGIFARYTADEYESGLRDGSRNSVGVTLRKPLTDRINLYSALAENRRYGKTAVFNTYDVSGRANLDYALAQGQALYLTGEYRKGDIVSTGRSSLAIFDIAEVFVRDDVFNSAGNNTFFDYRMKGRTSLWTLGYNLSLGTKDSMDFSLRRVQSTPDKSPGFTAPAMRYIDNQYTITYLMAF